MNDPNRPDDIAAYGDTADVEELLQRRADDVHPRGSFGDIERRIAADRTPARWRHPLAVAAAAVLALLVGATAVALTTGRDTDERVDTAAPTTGEPGPTTPTDPTASSSVTSTTPSSSTTTTTTVPMSTTTTTTTAPADSLSADSRITVRGLGPIVVPMELADVSQRIGYDLHRDDNSTPDPTSPCAFVSDVAGLPDLYLMLDGTRVVRVDVGEASTIRTVSGIGIGSTEAEVQAAYPAMVEVTPHPYTGGDGGHYLTVTDPSAPDYAITFETDGNKVIAYRSGLAEFVSYIEGCA